MTRETKVGLLVGMGLILLVGIILTDLLELQSSSDILPLDGRNTNVQDQVREPALGPDPIVDQAPESNGHYHAGLTETWPPSDLSGPVSVIAVDQEAVDQESGSSDPSSSSGPIHGNPPLPSPSQTSSGTQSTGDPRPPLGGERVLLTGPDDRLRPLDTPRGSRRFHAVKGGESLWKIATIYYGDGRFFPLIKKANPGRIMSGNRIRTGVRLVIPPKPQSSPSSDRRPRPVPPRAQPPTTPAIDPPRTITVRSGDTLGELAARHLGATRYWGALLEANRNQLDDEFDLQPGMVLKLPGQRPAPSAPAQTSTMRTAIPPDARRYTVEEGDTLWRIASKRLGDGNRYYDIYEANRNRITDLDELTVGQTLVLP